MRRALTSVSFLGLTVLGVAGCPDRTISEVIPEQGRVEHKHIPVTPRHDIDILFLIDDSPSMADKQANLAMNFPNFINVLNTIEGGLPNVHIGVAASDLGSKGADDAAPGPSIGSGPGAFVGALIVGIVEEVGTLVVPPTYKTAIGFVIILAVLLVRPTGLAGARS